MGFFLISYIGIYVPGCWLSGTGGRKEAWGPITHTQIVTETVNFILIVTPTIQCFSFFPGWRASLSQFLQGTIAWLCVLGESENLTIPYIGFQPIPLISAVSLLHFQRHLVLLSPEASPSFVRKVGSIFTVPQPTLGCSWLSPPSLPHLKCVVLSCLLFLLLFSFPWWIYTSFSSSSQLNGAFGRE